MTKKDLIINFVLEKIAQGIWVEGTKIFSENQFINYLHVSRNTVRGAIKELEIKGIIETIPNSGSFIKKSPEKKKEFILIITNEHTVEGDFGKSNKLLINKLKEQIVQAGYKPICYVNSNTLTIKDNLSHILNNIGGVISIGLYNTELTVFNNLNIPIVIPLRANATEYPTVMIDYMMFMKKITNLIEKYNFKKILVFTYTPTIVYFYKGYWDAFTIYGVENLFLKYDLKKFLVPKNRKYNNKPIDSVLKNIDYTPDCVLFLDDNIFSQTVPLFEKYEKIFKNTHIITQTTEETFIPPDYKISKVEINIEEFAKQSTKLLTKIINREFIKKYNIYISPNVIE